MSREGKDAGWGEVGKMAALSIWLVVATGGVVVVASLVTAVSWAIRRLGKTEK